MNVRLQSRGYIVFSWGLAFISQRCILSINSGSLKCQNYLIQSSTICKLSVPISRSSLWSGKRKRLQESENNIGNCTKNAKMSKHVLLNGTTRCSVMTSLTDMSTSHLYIKDKTYINKCMCIMLGYLFPILQYR